MSILTRSPSARVLSGSERSGEKWQIQLFCEMQVGNAIPFVNFLSFLKALLVSSVSFLSPRIQRSRTEHPGLHSSIISFSTLLTISAAILYLVTTKSSAMVAEIVNKVLKEMIEQN